MTMTRGKPYFRGDHDISLRKFQAYPGFAAKSFSVVAGCGVWGVGCGVLPVLRWPIT
ncbi:hypothetical protein GQR42_05720 [Microcystis aeruginosa FD4]|uniref:Uncharacterized protein n=1 Tax=Microcystis aeruginosa FD4 TaxID=2686288 RepID=A0A857D0F3_MICAE|nr:hypothetical protein GQR42_05720 [Microcystis aeruginosa FD4]